MAILRLATRGSRLALTQSADVKARLETAHEGLSVDLVPVKSTGDVRRTDALHQLGGWGLFTREVDAAVRSGEADFAVHSLKDLPTATEDGMVLAAVPERAPDEDLLVACESGSLEALPQGSTIATGSLRRGAQLLRWRPDLRIEPIRGNVETRIEKVRQQGWAGTVLARAGLERLGVRNVAAISLSGVLLPAAGQGALGITCREDDEATRGLLRALDHEPSHARVRAERTLLADLGAGCHAPVGVRSRLDGEELKLDAAVFRRDGSREAQGAVDGPACDPDTLGRELADRLREEGAGEILREEEEQKRG
jgi:hydroxymethylbilane synthase